LKIPQKTSWKIKIFLETVTDLVEFPTAIIANFNEKYLNLPKAVITSTLSEHQKYFPLINKEEKLINKFVFYLKWKS